LSTIFYWQLNRNQFAPFERDRLPFVRERFLRSANVLYSMTARVLAKCPFDNLPAAANV
jgi:hypothetical protein